MVALVSVETVLLVLLVVLVAGLLRSHAELLRRIGPADEIGDGGPAGVAADGSGDPILPQPPTRGRGTQESIPSPLSGVTPEGDPVTLAFARGGETATLLAFLTSGCSTCAGFWQTLGERRLPGVQTVIVTRGAERERPSAVRSLAPEQIAVVMSSVAWEDYGVPGAPYFVLVEEQIRGEGVATSWSALSSLIADAIGDARAARRPGAGEVRAQSVERTLAAAGIHPDDPSLHPSRAPVR